MDDTSLILMGNALIYASLFCIIVILLILTIYHQLKKQRQMINFSIALSLYGMAYLFLSIFSMNQIPSRFDELYAISSLTLLNWANYFLYLHYSSFVLLNPMNGGRHQIVFSSVWAATNINWFRIIGYLDPFPIIYFFSITALVGILVFSLALPGVIKNYRSQRNNALLVDVMVILLILGGAVAYTWGGINSVISGQKILQINYGFVGGAFNLCGVFGIFYNYMRIDKFYRPMKPINALFLYSETGVVLYSYISPMLAEFNNSIQDLTFKLYSTLDSLSKKIINPKAKLKMIQTRNYKVLFAQTKQKITFCVISSEITYFLKKSIEHFLKEFPIKNAIGQLNSGVRQNSEMINNLVEKVFCSFLHTSTILNTGEINCVI